ncbi:MAG: hypothetical protein ABI861_14205 [Panacibacter sp.]
MDYSFVILIASVFISRWLLLSAFKQLTDEEKAKVLSGNIIRLSQITLVTTILMVVVFYFMIVNYPHSYQSISSSFFAVLILQRIVAYFITRKSMISNGIPAAYIKKYFLSWLVTTVGVIIFIFMLVKNNF